MGEHQGYPVILGGDHAAFEIEHAGMDPKMRPDWPLPSFDSPADETLENTMRRLRVAVAKTEAR